MAKIKNKKSSTRRRVRVRKVATSSLGQDGIQYRKLLLDPCNGPLVPPPAIGVNSGYMVRLRRVVPLTGNSAGLSTTGFSYVTWYARLNPSNASLTVYMAKSGDTQTGASNTALKIDVDLETGFLANARSYRVVAACMKFVPTGAIGTRTGSVGAAYIPDNVGLALPASGVAADNVATQLLTMSQRTVSNASGPEVPEVRWFPADPAELDFRNRAVEYLDDASCAVLTGYRVDGSQVDSTQDTLSVNGYLDVTLVCEWLPNYDQGIVATAVAPTRTTFQNIMASISDLGRAAVDSGYAQKLMSGVAQYGAGMMMNAIANAVVDTRPGRGLLTA